MDNLNQRDDLHHTADAPIESATEKMTWPQQQFFFDSVVLPLHFDRDPTESAIKLMNAVKEPDDEKAWRMIVDAKWPLEALELDILSAEHPPFEQWYRDSWIRHATSKLNVHRPYEELRMFLATRGAQHIVDPPSPPKPTTKPTTAPVSMSCPLARYSGRGLGVRVFSSLAKTVMKFQPAILLMFLASASIAAPRLNNLPQPVILDQIKDTYTPIPFDDATITGMIGDRMQDNITNRLLKVDELRILAGFQHPPGEQIWIGEHAGKFLHAAANAWANSGNEELKAKMDRVAHALIAAQQPDGYLGTYTIDQRWTSWDVWVHAYDLLGLMRYDEVTGDTSALNCCRKIGDLLCNTFGDDDPKRATSSPAIRKWASPPAPSSSRCVTSTVTPAKSVTSISASTSPVPTTTPTARISSKIHRAQRLPRRAPPLSFPT